MRKARKWAWIDFSGQILADAPAKDLKPMAEEAIKKWDRGLSPSYPRMAARHPLSWPSALDLKAQYSAVDLVRLAAAAVGGKGGGGRPDMAQAGGR